VIEMGRTYEVGGRYGYFCVDIYDEKGGMLGTAICGLTRKVAQTVASELAQAYRAGTLDSVKSESVRSYTRRG
jgi:hypothetical protein